MAKKSDKGTKTGKKRSIKGMFTKKRVILLAGALVILAAAGGGAWFFLFSGSEEPPPEKFAEVSEKQEGIEAPPVFPEIVELELFDRIPLKPSGTLDFITLAIALELFDPGSRQNLERDILSVRHVIEMEAREMSWLALRSPEGKLKFKYRLIKRINATVPATPVRNVYFTQLIMH